MSVWRQLRRGLSNLRDRSASDRDVSDEVAHYLEELTRDGVRRGLSEADARRAARVALRGETQVREQVRGYGWERLVESFVEDVRSGWRRLAGSPGFGLVAVATLGLGIGGATTIFAVANPVLFAPLPYPQPDRIRAIAELHPDGARGAATYGMYRGLAEGSRTFAGFSVFRPWQPTLTGPDRPERLDGQRVTAGYFGVLGVAPALGRDFDAADDRPGAPPVVLVSDAFWRERLAADPGAVGTALRLDDAAHTVIGVLPAGFENVLAPGADVWAPLAYDLADGRAWGRHLAMIGRLAGGADPGAAVVELNAVGQRVVREQRPPTYDAAVVWTAPSLRDEVARGSRAVLVAVLAAVGLVLVLACVNVTSLVLARLVRRRDELALRTALGAGRLRIARQLLTESLVLAVIGGAAGVGVALVGVRSLVAAAPEGLPRLHAMTIDPPTLLFAFVITLLAGLALGVPPAAQAAARDRRALRPASARSIGGRRHRLQGGLVVAQVALAMVLLAGSGLLLKSMQRLLAVSPGLEPAGLLTLQVQASAYRFGEEGGTVRFFADALDAIRRVPAVEAAALTSQLPLSGDHDVYGVHLDVSTAAELDDRGAFRYGVSPGYLEVMGIPLRAGRGFDEGDRAGAPRVALVSESFARRRFPGVDPIGQQLRIGPTTGAPYTVVGVAGDVRQLSLADDAADAVYTTPGQWRFEDNVVSFVVRGRGDMAALVPAVRDAIWSVDADQPIVRVAAMTDLVDRSAAQRRFALTLFQLFGLVALVLATAGLYGMLAGAVAERTREIGLRSAIGATRSRVVRLVVRQGLGLVVSGMALGLAAAMAATRTIEALLHDVSRLDPATYIAVAAILAGAALLACAVPAWRAARIDPATTLRTD